MRTQIDLTKKMRLKVFTLTVFASNEKAIYVCRKVGFVQTGKIAKKHFKYCAYIDEVIMTNLTDESWCPTSSPPTPLSPFL